MSTTAYVNPQFDFELTFTLNRNEQFEELHQQLLEELDPDLCKDGVVTFDTDSFRKAFQALLSWLESVEKSYSEGNQGQTDSEPIRNIYWNGSGMGWPEFARKLHELSELDEEIQGDLEADSVERKEGWGYSRLESLNRYLPDNVRDLETHIYWFDLGYFKDDDVWVIDKQRIIGILKQEIKDKELYLCPAFKMQRVLDIVSRLPDSLDVTSNKNWSKRYENRIDENRVVSKPVGVIHKATLNGNFAGDSGKPSNGKSGSQSYDTEASFAHKKARIKGEDSTKDNDKEQERKQREIPKTSFDEIGGLDHLISNIREVVELPLKYPKLFSHLGIEPHKGILLHGPPGCGKTMIAKAIAHDIQAHFISIKGPEMLNKYYGQSEENIRNIFEEAGELQPSIIFFDEIDSIAQQRSSNENLRMDARLVNQLLSLMDGIETYGSVCVIAATNRVELIDDALTRPGRFDYNLKIPLPDVEGCKQIFSLATEGMPVAEEVSTEEFGGRLTGYSGAEISFVAREGAYNCLRRHMDLRDPEAFKKIEEMDYSKLVIKQEDFELALSKLNEGSQTDESSGESEGQGTNITLDDPRLKEQLEETIQDFQERQEGSEDS